jgi:hypothetical protein
MKSLFLAVCLGLMTGRVFGQGQVIMSTAVGDTYAKFSNTVSASFFTGGSIYVALYWSTNAETLAAGGGTQVTNSTAATPVGVNGSGIATNTPSGFVASTTGGGNRFIGPRAGQLTYFQLRAWSANSGVYSYGDALTSGDPNVFVSRITGPNAAPIVSATPTLNSLANPPVLAWNPGSTSSSQAISVAMDPVPEPSTIALVGLGLAGLIFIRRRR